MPKLTGFCRLPCTYLQHLQVKHLSIYAKIRLSLELDCVLTCLWECYNIGVNQQKCIHSIMWEIHFVVISLLEQFTQAAHRLTVQSHPHHSSVLCCKNIPNQCSVHTLFKISCMDFKVLIPVFRCDASIINQTRIPSPHHHLMKNCPFHIPFGYSCSCLCKDWGFLVVFQTHVPHTKLLHCNRDSPSARKVFSALLIQFVLCLKL